MEITVSRAELEQTFELLRLLKDWEKMQCISGDYNQGEVVFNVKGNDSKVLSIGNSVDMYGLRRHPDNTAVKACHKEIAVYLAGVATEASKQVCKIIKGKMPIPVSEGPF